MEPGNIDLNNRPQVKVEGGKTATVRSIHFEEDGVFVVIPTVSDDGRLLSNEEALAQYDRTGKHLGKFKTDAAAEAYGKRLSAEQRKQYRTR